MYQPEGRIRTFRVPRLFRDVDQAGRAKRNLKEKNRQDDLFTGTNNPPVIQKMQGCFFLLILTHYSTLY